MTVWSSYKMSKREVDKRRSITLKDARVSQLYIRVKWCFVYMCKVQKGQSQKTAAFSKLEREYSIFPFDDGKIKIMLIQL